MRSFEDVSAFVVSLVVELTDPLRQGGRPIGSMRVRLRDRLERPILNGSGHYVFTDLPVALPPPAPPPPPSINPYQLEVNSSLGLYLPELVTVGPLPPPIPSPVPSPVFPPPPVPFPRIIPQITIPLRPTASYPFPSVTSLVRGMVREGPRPLENVPLTVTVHDPAWLEALWTTNVTTQSGGFVFAFKVKKPGLPPPPPPPPAKPALEVTLTASYTPPAGPPPVQKTADVLVKRNSVQSVQIVYP